MRDWGDDAMVGVRDTVVECMVLLPVPPGVDAGCIGYGLMMTPKLHQPLLRSLSRCLGRADD